MQQPLLHVIIINWNGVEHLDACLSSLAATTYTNVRFLLVDNASTDDSREFFDTHFAHDPRFEFLPLDSNRGWGGGNNAGIRAALDANADYVFLLNNDTATDPEAIEIMVEQAQSDSRVGCLAPKMLMFDQPDILNSIGVQCALTGSCWDRGIGRIDAPAWDTPIETIAACGGAAFYRTEALRLVGMIDEAYGIYFDDVDLNLRMWSHGYKTVTCPGARVRHKFSASFGSEAGRRRKYFLGTRNRLRMVCRNFPANRAAEWLPPLIKGEVKALGRALLDRELWRVSAHLRAWADTLHALPEIRRTRGEWHRTRRNPQAFWHLLDRSLLFCPELVLPVQGWYPEYQGYLPMARHAWREVNAGRLRISLTNCYSAKRPLTVSVALNGAPLATLVSNGDTAFEGAIQAGTLEFEAHDFLPAEETGLPYDCGGWIAIEAMAAN